MYKTRSWAKAVTYLQFVQRRTISGTPSNFCFPPPPPPQKKNQKNKLLCSINTEQPAGNSANYTEIESEISEWASRQVETDESNKLGFLNMSSAEIGEITTRAETT